MARPFTLIVLLSAHLCLHVVVTQDEDSHINTQLLSSVLDRLTNRTTYDKRLRPRYGEKPVDVGITIHVSSISAVSEVDMDFTLDFYMRQTWQDPRLAFGSLDLGLSKEIDSLTVGVDYLDRLWKPDTFFPNEKKSFFHLATTHNSFLRIEGDGTVYTSQRLTVTATCPMDLKLFPMDSQHCKLEIESYAYSTAEIEYKWCTSKEPNCSTAVKADANIELSSYKFTKICQKRTLASTSSGTYSRLRVSFIFDRDSGFYFLQIFFPASLVVVLSWISFWINRDSAPSRTLIGTMTVLTETHLMTGTNRRLPPVAYVKAVDVFLGFCYLLVILALIEYACVAYSKKKNEDRRRREKKTEHKPAPPTPDILHDVRLAECTCNAAPTSIIAVIKQSNRFCVSHSHIDIVSRAAFPLVFILFNTLFWLILLYKSKRLPYISEHEGDRCDAPDLH
ncbi:Gamma-aminobutyric acid receptor subunit beta [Caenorhabditis elegans]|uniref:Gamma-aminobutyric acid receptor subunit beta n=3 Tax=Caenorhabditis elegans TaxID=6239 RepID=G5EE10_CAEEL|nr:Gamma-aminobutyric acid receptor subunit beta [Caenorhabditis elegans]AAD42386.1 ionotropic GABA receptor subunit UNC-49C [Caenorhabditis elegans]CAC42350.1 Gamma-aminobutyric acid receptor subunit beta [Caenorhabditis elegans]|eukprot:NP_001022786.1 Uncharacterized protein CELE_T21C12.1 [Caenorhabditis elegans]